MSSYHVLNAVWIGVFPMLAVTILISIILYFVCCLNRIKTQCSKYCSRKRQKKREKKKRDIEANYPSKGDDENIMKKKKSIKCLRDPYDEDNQFYGEDNPSLMQK
jgi:hypothetical protein